MSHKSHRMKQTSRPGAGDMLREAHDPRDKRERKRGTPLDQGHFRVSFGGMGVGYVYLLHTSCLRGIHIYDINMCIYPLCGFIN